MGSKNKMKQSIYNITVNKDGFYLIFNQMKNTGTVLNEETFKRMVSNELNEEEKSHLFKRGVLVEDDFNEKEYCIFKRKQFKEYDRDNSVYYRILLTTYCNANCYYCYEKDFPKSKMSSETEKRLIDNIKREALSKKQLTIEWFGGEPLLEYKRINAISLEISDFCKQYNIKFKSNIITNGFLFKEYNVRECLKNWNVNRVQITLDGLKEKYESVKLYNQDDSFETVMDNIAFLLDRKINVDIRINYNSENIDEALKLIDFLSENFKNNELLNVYAYQIFDFGKCDEMNNDSELEKIVLQRLYERGFLKDVFSKLYIRMGCQANRYNGGTITPCGDIYRCSMALIDKKNCVGTIFDESKKATTDEWIETDLPQKCIMCSYLPICGGGCAFLKFRDANHCSVNPEIVKFKLMLVLNDFINKERR